MSSLWSVLRHASAWRIVRVWYNAHAPENMRAETLVAIEALAALRRKQEKRYAADPVDYDEWREEHAHCEAMLKQPDGQHIRSILSHADHVRPH